MTLLPVNHCFHRIRILIISDGLVTGVVIPVGETVVNFVNISSFSVHDALVTQGSVTRKGQILRPTPNTAPLICGACYNTQPEDLLTMA